MLALAALVTATGALPEAGALPSRAGGEPGLTGATTTTMGRTPGGLTTGGAVDPGPPMAVRRGSLAPLAKGEIDDLLGTRPAAGSACEVNFNDPAGLQFSNNYAPNTFVVWPFYYRACGTSYVRVKPTNIDHFHVNYADPDVVPCENPDNDHGTPLGGYGRGAQECEPIDVATEPRGYAHTMLPDDLMKVEHADGTPMRFDRVRILNRITDGHGHGPSTEASVTVRTCFQQADPGPWEAGSPPTEHDHPGQYCWNLTSGLWDLSAYTAGSRSLTLTLADNSPNFSFDDIRVTF